MNSDNVQVKDGHAKKTGVNPTRREVIAAVTGIATSLTTASAVVAADKHEFDSHALAATTQPQLKTKLHAPQPDGQSNAERALKVISAAHLEMTAKQTMSPLSYAIVAGGVGDEVTLRLNTSVLSDLMIRPRRLQGFSAANLTTRLLGMQLPFPFYVTPMGQNDLVHSQAELAVARGAAAAGALYVASGAAHYPMERIAQASSGPKWFQIYMNNDPAVNRALLARARRADYSAIVLVVDAMGPGFPEAAQVLTRDAPAAAPRHVGNDEAEFGGVGNFYNLKRDFSLHDIAVVREASNDLPVFVKGLLRADDAVRCMDAGATGVIVSNHGGRQMDGVPASISVLRAIVEAVDSRGPVLFDGGVRRGIDIVRALALGATAVGIGRPVLYALAMGGGAGVTSLLNHLQEELARAMLLAGAANIAALSMDYLEPLKSSPQCS